MLDFLFLNDALFGAEEHYERECHAYTAHNREDNLVCKYVLHSETESRLLYLFCRPAAVLLFEYQTLLTVNAVSDKREEHLNDRRSERVYNAAYRIELCSFVCVGRNDLRESHSSEGEETVNCKSDKVDKLIRSYYQPFSGVCVGVSFARHE